MIKAETEIKIGSYTYTVVDERPKLKDWYINLFVSPMARSMQMHTEKRHLINHRKDYRFPFCCKVIASNDPNFTSPSPKQN